jgi:hypothetical protein
MSDVQQSARLRVYSSNNTTLPHPLPSELLVCPSKHAWPTWRIRMISEERTMVAGVGVESVDGRHLLIREIQKLKVGISSDFNFGMTKDKGGRETKG